MRFCWKDTFFNNINWRYVQRKNVVNNVDMSRWGASWQNGPYKNKHTEQHKNTQNTKTQQKLKNFIYLFYGFFLFILAFSDNFLNYFSKICVVTALVRSMTKFTSQNTVRFILIDKKAYIRKDKVLCSKCTTLRDPHGSQLLTAQNGDANY